MKFKICFKPSNADFLLKVISTTKSTKILASVEEFINEVESYDNFLEYLREDVVDYNRYAIAPPSKHTHYPYFLREKLFAEQRYFHIIYNILSNKNCPEPIVYKSLRILIKTENTFWMEDFYRFFKKANNNVKYIDIFYMRARGYHNTRDKQCLLDMLEHIRRWNK